MSTSRNDNILFSKNKFTKKGSGIQLVLGIIVLTSADLDRVKLWY